MEDASRDTCLIRKSLESKLDRLHARWRLFNKRVRDVTRDDFVRQRQQFQEQARKLRLLIMRSRQHSNDLPHRSLHLDPNSIVMNVNDNVNNRTIRRFTTRWSFVGSAVHCPNCKAMMWREERSHGSSHAQPRFNLCCQSGKILLLSLPPPPPLLDSLMNDANFLKNIRTYNSMLSFTSMGGIIDHSILDGRGPYSFRISGGNYHKIGSLLPYPGDKPKFAQLYIYDTQYEAQNRCHALGNPEGVNINVIKALQQMLDAVNPYVQTFRSARDFLKETNVHDLQIRIIQSRNGTQYTRPASDEVATLIVGGENEGHGHLDIILHTLDARLHRVYENHPSYMPLQYPLLFPHGTDGWRSSISLADGSTRSRESVSMREFYAYYIQFRVDDPNILLCGARLFLQFLVDCFAAIEAFRLNYIKDHQGVLQADLYCGLQDAITTGEADANAVGRRYILPSSFTGGPRYMRQHFLDAMAICSHMGYPDFFITFTCNPNWPEIKEILLQQPGKSSSDRPDIVVRVFRLKLKELTRDLKERTLFGRVVSDIGVIEFQKRGLPHAHILITLSTDDKPTYPEDIDVIISAEIPNEHDDPLAYETIKRHMIHGPCGIDVGYAPCMEGNKCTKHYPKTFCENTCADENGFVRYRRRNDGKTVIIHGKLIDNRWVVPYNRDLCVKYDAHINVERCAQKKVIKYLHKYMHKGPDRATFVIEDNSIHTNEGTHPQYREVNEIKQYLDCRYISATEAVWRIFDFELTFRYPSVEKLQFHMPGEQYVVFNNNDNLHSVVENALRRLTMLTAWFKINRKDIQANCYTYVEFPPHYVWDKGGKIWHRRQQRLCIGRLPYAHPNSGERYYLRMLLTIVRGAKCYEDLRTVDGILYPTFRDACLARGLLDDCNEWHDALSEASTWATAAQLRRMFCSILMFSEVAQPERLWEQHWDDLTDDLQRRLQLEQGDPTLILSIQHRKNLGLYELELILNKNGHSLKDYPPMPLPLIETTLQTRSMLIREHLDYDTYREAENFTVLLQSLNCDQLQVFEAVMTAYDKGEGGSFFVYGSGGTGKTHLWKTIIACFRSKRLITLSVASSGIAALLLPMGKTAHSMFKIPIDLDDTTLCSISKNSDTAELLRQASLIIWDEAPMTHRHAFEALERTLRDVCNNDSLFGGKLIIFRGDFRQILPVVSKGS